jgi:predicted O-methyltransferase YrrM
LRLFERRRRERRELSFRVQTLETAVDCLLNSPKYVDAEDVGFNGQKFRKAIFGELVRAFAFEAIVETGTYTGNTTGYMARKTGLPVYTCEVNRTYFSVARRRLEDVPNVTLRQSESCAFLRALAKDGVAAKRCFIYLDAHWHEALPLAEEIDVICGSWKDFVVMVDDFQVPGDAGYGYDDYGKAGRLTIADFAPVVARGGLVPFFPSLPSAQETGYKRGSVILARKGEASEILAGLKVLTRGTP